MPNKPGHNLGKQASNSCTLLQPISVRAGPLSAVTKMSSDSSLSTWTVDISLYCPACGDPFRAAEPSSEPRLFRACGHTVCATCADAVAACPDPACPICTIPTGGSGVRDEAFALAAEAAFGSVTALDSAAAGGPPPSLHSKKRKNRSFQSEKTIHPAILCSQHGDCPLDRFASDIGKPVCTWPARLLFCTIIVRHLFACILTWFFPFRCELSRLRGCGADS